MLVLNVINEDMRRRNGISGRKKKIFYPERYNACIGNKLYNIVDIRKENLNDSSVMKLLSINRNKVLKCSCNDVNEHIKDYLMDITPYLKRAILSAVIKELEQGLLFENLCVKDSSFVESKEYYSLAKKLRKLSVVCDNVAINNFRDICYNNLGLGVENVFCSEYQAFLDFDSIVTEKGAFITVNDNQILVYADEEYFFVDDNVSKLMKYEVPKEYACASLRM